MRSSAIETYRTLESNGSQKDFSIHVYKRFKTPFYGSEVLFGTTDEGEDLAVKFSTFPQGAKREWQGLNTAYTHHVPTPEPKALIADPAGKIGIVSQKIEGNNLYRASTANIKNHLGVLIRKMHDEIPVSGVEWGTHGRKNFSFYDERINKWEASPIGEISQNSRVLSLLKKFYQPTRDTHYHSTPAFVHFDLHDDQVFLTKHKNLVIFDFENWKESHPLNDVAIYLFHSLRTKRPPNDFVAFLQGYLKGRGLSENEKAVMAFHLLFTSIRGVDYYSRLRTREFTYAKDYLQRAVQYIDKERLWKI